MLNVVFTISAHERPDGRVPFQDALFDFGAVSPDLLAAVEAGLARLKFGRNHRNKLTGYIEKDLFELRIKNARVFFTFKKGSRIILLNGFIKNQPKTPIKQLKLARQLKKEVMA